MIPAVLADTSVWVEHFRKGHRHLEVLLNMGRVVCHPLIVGELSCGHLSPRRQILAQLQALPSARTGSHDEVLGFIEKRSLFGLGIGLIDAHLLVSAELSDLFLWTTDKPLMRAASRLKIAYIPRLPTS